MTRLLSKKSLFYVRANTSRAINHILSSDLISPSESLRARWNYSFRKSLNLRAIIPTFSLLALIIGFIVSAIAILVLCLVINVPFWIYIIYGVSGAFIISFSALIGSFFPNYKRRISRRKVLEFTMESLIAWTANQLEIETDLNNKRFLIENLIHSLFAYENHPKVKSRKLRKFTNQLIAIIDRDEWIEAIKIAMRLFEIIFSDEAAIFDESGILYLMKIFIPLQKLTTSPKLSEHINQLLKKFMVDTRISVNHSKYSVISTGERSKIKLSDEYFTSEKLELPFFDDLWKIPTSILIKKQESIGPLQTHQFDFNSDEYRQERDPEYFEHRMDEVVNTSRKYSKAEENVIEISPLSTEFGTNQGLETEVRPLVNQSHDSQIKDQSNLEGKSRNQSEIHNQSNNISIASMAQSKMTIKRIMTIRRNEAEVVVSFRQPENSEEIIEEINIQKVAAPSVDLDPAILRLLSLYNANIDDFVLLNKAPRIRVSKHKNEKPAIMVRSDFEINLSAQRVYQLIYDISLRTQWDKNLSKFKIMKVYDEFTDLYYCYFKAPPFVTDRDYLQKRILVKNHENIDYIIGFISVDDEEFPPLKGIIRAYTHISGYIITSTGDSTCKLTAISQTDFKGNIPKTIMNQAVQKGPIDWLAKIESASAEINDSF